MHLVILAAGTGSRLHPLTDTVPKPLLLLCGQSIIEHSISDIIEYFDDIYIIVKYMKESFVEYFGDTYLGKKVHYVDQIETGGTGAAILSLQGHISGRFVVVSGDDIYSGSDILALRECSTYATLCKAVDKPENFGIFQCDASGKPISIIEKPTDISVGNFANVGVHIFDDSIFEELSTIPLSVRGELEITDLISRYIERGIYSVIEAKGRWIAIGYPWDILTFQETYIANIDTNIHKDTNIEPQVYIQGNVHIGQGSVLKSGTYIEGNVWIGDNVTIGPNAYIRGNTHIGDGSRVGASVELKNSYIGKNTNIPHLSYIGDSILGNYINIGGGSKVANLRHDGADIRVMVKGKLVSTGKRKLGMIVGDGAKLGVDTLVYPGRKIEAGGTTLPGEIMK